MNKVKEYESIKYDKKNHDIKCHTDQRLDAHINTAMEIVNSHPGIKFNKAEFLRLGMENFCDQVIQGIFNIGMIFEIKEDKCEEVKNGKK